MNATLLGLMADYGVWALFAILLLSSAGLPFPSSLTVLAAGSIAAQGDLDPYGAFAAAVGGAIVGDQIGYAVGRYGGRALIDKATARFGGAAKVAAAEAFARRWSGAGIFFTRWLAGALGPWINVTSGVSEYPWPRFVLWDVVGEMLWVVLYGGLGYAFSDRIQAVASLLGNISWAIAGLGVTGFLAWRLLRHRRATDTGDDASVATVE